MKFINLHVHTSLGSMQDSLISVKGLFNRVVELDQPAVAITDNGMMSSTYDAWKEFERTGVKFIPGCEEYFVYSYDTSEQIINNRRKQVNETRKHITLLAQNNLGYKNLLKINYEAFKHREIKLGHVYPRLNWEVLENNTDGIICLSGDGNGLIAEKLMLGDINAAKEVTQKLAKLFPNRFFLELQSHHLKSNRVDQEWINEGLIQLSKELKLPLVVTTDAHYLVREEKKYHDMLLAIRMKKPLNKTDFKVDEFYLKSGDEVYDFMSKHYGELIAIESISNTIEIANMCESPSYLKPSGNHLPDFPVQDEIDYDEFLEWKNKNKSVEGLEDATAFMRFRCFKEFKNKLSHLSLEKRKQYWDRIKYEVKILEKNNFSGYMLVVSDYIKWSKENGILVGIGRGSVGGSLVAYLLDIHGVDPFEYGLLFERFQNAEKTDLPDIDTDFMSAGRDLAEEYVRKKYGYDNCAQVSNLMTYTPKNVVDDVARSLRLGDDPNSDKKNYFFIAKMIKDSIPNDADNFDQAKEMSKKFVEFANKYPELLEYSEKLLGKEKGYSTHAAGIVIADKPIVEFAPVRIDKNGVVAVQYEKNRCESVGLVKMDFLGLSTLDVIAETLKNIKKLNEIGPDKMENIPLDDKETYQMISDGNTKCVFQLGKTSMMTSLCKRIKPKNIFDIAIINALGRPSSGPRTLEDGSSYDERSAYISRRNGSSAISYLHPSLSFLEETYGLCIMEEQLMSVAKHCAGWDLNKADKLRKFTKLKKKGAELAKQLEKDFIKGMMDTHSVSYDKAVEVWKGVIEKFGGYGFNRSHAVFYSINGYYTAYLKKHHPVAFLAAKLKIETMRTSLASDAEIEFAKQECRRLGIKIMPPDVNQSGIGYDVLDSKTIIMGLSAVKGLGIKAVEDVFAKQPYDSMVDFLHKTIARIVNKTRIEALAKAGCFGSLGVSRKFAFEEGRKTREKLLRYLKKRDKDGYDINSSLLEFPFENIKEEWSIKELLVHEREVLGDCISGSLNELYDNFFTGYNITPLSKLTYMPDRAHLVVEVLVKAATREFTIKKQGRNFGKKMVKYLVEDIHGDSTELTVWPAQYKIAKKFLADNTPIRAQCQVSEFSGQKTLMLMSFQSIYGVGNAKASKKT